jgi:hypothetical protein
MSRWTCPRCDREFERAHQAHVCVPGCTVEDTFAGRPPAQRAIYDAILAHLRSLGPVHVDAVSVGVFLKAQRKLAELRPMARSVSVGLFLPRLVDDPRIARRISVSADRTVHIVRLTVVDQLDDQLRGWLTEAYDAASK